MVPNVPENRTRVSVLIVGAGPTGLTAAMELSRMGVEVRIVDRAPEPSSTSRALGVQARTLELLRVRGVGGEMVRAGNKVAATALYARGKQLGAIDFTTIPSEFNHILLLAQSETERLLTVQAARHGVKVERGVTVGSVMSRSDCATVELVSADGTREVVDSTYVIAADGSHSALRKSCGLSFEGKSLAHSYVLGDLRIDGDVPEDQLSIFLGRRAFLAVFPMGDGRYRFMATDPDGVCGADGDPGLADIQTLYDRASHIPARLHGLNWSSRFRINSRHMSTLRSGRVFFGGDAAHVHSPAGGQGMNAGIQDMIDLSWKLAMVLGGQARLELLDTYETDRLPVIHDLVAMTERATAVFNTTNPVAHGALTRLAPVLLKSPVVQRKAAPRLAQIVARYRAGTLAEGGGRIGGLHAGDRVPDWRVTSARGCSFRLYDLLDLSTPTLLTFGDDAGIRDAHAPWSDVIPAHGVDIAEADGSPTGPCWLLVRPDGYLAAAGRPDQVDVLTGWLDAWVVRPAR